MGVNSLPKTVTRQRRDCDLNRRSCAPESSTLTTGLYRATPTCVYILDVCYRYTVAAALKAKAMFSAQLFDCCQTRQSRMDRCAFIADGNNNYTVSRYIVVTQLNAYSRYIHALLTSNGCYITGALNGSTKAHAPLLRFVVDLSNCCVYDKSTTHRSNGVWA